MSWEFDSIGTVKKAANSDCVSELQGMVYSAVEEVDRVRGIVADDQVQLDAWDEKLRHAINERMKLREAVLDFLSSMKGQRGAILGGLSFGKLDALRAVVGVPERFCPHGVEYEHESKYCTKCLSEAAKGS